MYIVDLGGFQIIIVLFQYYSTSRQVLTMEVGFVTYFISLYAVLFYDCQSVLN